jgi:Fe2+ transport system protein B
MKYLSKGISEQFFLNVPPKLILQVEASILFTHNFTLQLFGYLNTKKYFQKTFQSKLLLNDLFHPKLYFTAFRIPQHQEILFKDHFRASYFLNVSSKPILQVEVLIFFIQNYTLQLLGYLNIKKYFSKTISEQVTFLLSLLNPFYKLKYLSFSPKTILYSF